MAPKKRTTKAKDVKSGNGTGNANKTSANTTKSSTEANKNVKDEASATEVKDGKNDQAAREDKKTENLPKKRTKDEATEEPPRKALRRSGRSEPKGQPSQQQLLNYLLSDAATELTRPDDETEDIQTRGANIRTYTASALNPFEELLCAIILSRPISHRLGLRTIRTVLSEPYNFTSARALRDAGDEKRLQSVYDARTQHKDKTAAQMGILAEAVLEHFTTKDDSKGTQLGKLREDCGDDVGQAAKSLKKNIKGLGQTGLEIFFRRVQWIYTAAFPNVDTRTADALRLLGLPQDGEQLVALIEASWGKLETGGFAGEDKEARKRRALVVLLERATGAHLEHKVDAVLAAAATA